MKFEAFQAGRLQQRYQYKSFEPASINLEWTWDDPLINTLLELANPARASMRSSVI